MLNNGHMRRAAATCSRYFCVSGEGLIKKYLARGGEFALIWCIGSFCYSAIEILWRGFTHWTMTLTGGVCLVCVYYADCRMKNCRLWLKCLAGCAIITSVELAVGCLVNRLLRWNVWDYSDKFMNLWGQICLLYSALWFLLCIPAVSLCGMLRSRLRRG